MKEGTHAGRVALRWAVGCATGLPIVVNAVLIVLFESGRLGRCDGIWLVGRSFMVSIGMFVAALAGTGAMLLRRRGEPLWVLLVAAAIQAACLALAIMPFLRG